MQQKERKRGRQINSDLEAKKLSEEFLVYAVFHLVLEVGRNNAVAYKPVQIHFYCSSFFFFFYHQRQSRDHKPFPTTLISKSMREWSYKRDTESRYLAASQDLSISEIKWPGFCENGRYGDNQKAAALFLP